MLGKLIKIREYKIWIIKEKYFYRENKEFNQNFFSRKLSKNDIPFIALKIPHFISLGLVDNIEQTNQIR